VLINGTYLVRGTHIAAHINGTSQVLGPHIAAHINGTYLVLGTHIAAHISTRVVLFVCAPITRDVPFMCAAVCGACPDSEHSYQFWLFKSVSDHVSEKNIEMSKFTDDENEIGMNALNRDMLHTLQHT
jgi:hypothetical protein